jgi:hypothetical protein
VEAKQRRLNIFLRHSSTHELVNVSFFHESANLDEWHESKGRLATLEKLRPLLDGPIDVQVYEVERVIGIGETLSWRKITAAFSKFGVVGCDTRGAVLSPRQ